MDYQEFVKALRQRLDSELGGLRFKRIKNGRWVRADGTAINVVELQVKSDRTRVCVNLGTHWSFLPKRSSGSESLSIEAAEAADCEIETRLVEHSSDVDQWWDFSLASVEGISDSLVKFGLPWFERHRDLRALVVGASVADIESGCHPFLSMLTKPRAALMLARIQEYSGDIEHARSVAEWGIKNTGLAVAVRSQLKDLLRRLDAQR
jgi:hypothetical protein